MRRRSLNVAGSPSAALHTANLVPVPVVRMARHLSPVGNPAPPRPRRPLFAISPITASGDAPSATSSPRPPPSATYSSRVRGAWSRRVIGAFPEKRDQSGPHLAERSIGPGRSPVVRGSRLPADPRGHLLWWGRGRPSWRTDERSPHQRATHEQGAARARRAAGPERPEPDRRLDHRLRGVDGLRLSPHRPVHDLDAPAGTEAVAHADAGRLA